MRCSTLTYRRSFSAEKCLLTLAFTLLGWAGNAASSEPELELNEQELRLAHLIENHSNQSRPRMILDPILHLVARSKAQDLGERGYEGHVDPDGYGPNEAILAAGYGLPRWWADQTDRKSNHVESLGFGYNGSPDGFFDRWLNSPGHRRHLLAESSFYQGQTHFAVGYAYVENSKYKHYYSFISAPPNEAPFTDWQPYSEWLFEHFTVQEIRTTNDDVDDDGDGLGRLLEYVLGTDPKTKDLLPPLTLSPYPRQLLWHFESETPEGPAKLVVEVSPNMIDWRQIALRREDDVVAVDLSGPEAYFRLRARRY